MKFLFLTLLVFWIFTHGLCYTINLLTSRTNINANNEPTLRCSPSSISDLSVCNSSSVQFRHNNVIINTTSSSKYELNTFYDHASLTIRNVVPSDGGCYGCSYICSGTIVNADNVCLTFVSPIIFLTPDNTVYYSFVGSNATLECDAQHYSNLEWQTESGVVILASHKYNFQGNNLVINNVSVSDQKSYLCAANNEITHITTITARLQVYMVPVVTVIGNSSVSIYEGNTTTFVCQATAIPRPSIIWTNENNIPIGGRIQSNEVNIGNDTVQSTLTISSTKQADGGPYNCSGATSNGTSTVTFHLNVKSVPEPYLRLYFVDSNSTCATIMWEVFGVPNNANITITWSLAGLHNETVGETIVMQSSSFLTIFNLLPNTSYIITASLLGLMDSITINTSIIYTSIIYTSIIAGEHFLPSTVSFHVLSTLLITEMTSKSSSPTPVLLFSSIASITKITPIITQGPSVESDSAGAASIWLAIGSALVVCGISIVLVIIIGLFFYWKMRTISAQLEAQLTVETSTPTGEILLNRTNFPPAQNNDPINEGQQAEGAMQNNAVDPSYKNFDDLNTATSDQIPTSSCPAYELVHSTENY